MRILSLFSKLIKAGLPSIDLEEEVGPFREYLTGITLNAGSGKRPLKAGDLTINCDFDESAPVDVIADLHYLPFKDNAFESIVSVAVLEHTKYPWVCIKELYRVLKPGGTIVIGLPFIQPEHAVPHDFFRYTRYGIRSLLEWGGFEVVKVESAGRYYRSLAWVINEKVVTKNIWIRRLFSPLIYRIGIRAKYLCDNPKSVYTGSYAIATKPGTFDSKKIYSDKYDFLIDSLVDPVTKSAIKIEDLLIKSELEVYSIYDGKFDLRPKNNLSQDSKHKWK